MVIKAVFIVIMRSGKGLKKTNNETIYFVYDENGQLIGEYDSNNNPNTGRYITSEPIGLTFGYVGEALI